MTRRCCCGAFSITTGAKILAALMIVGAVCSIISVFIPDPKEGTAMKVGTGLSSVVELIVGVFVLIACKQQRAVLMTPMLAYVVLSLFVLAISFILCVYGLFDQHSIIPNWIRPYLEKDDVNTTSEVITTTEQPINPEQLLFMCIIIMTLACGIAFALTVWYLNVFYNCYKHLREQEGFIAGILDVSVLQQGWSVTFIKAMFAIEIVVLLGGSILTAVAIYLMNASPPRVIILTFLFQRLPIHVNLKRIMIAFMSHFYVLAISRIVLMLFETGMMEAERHIAILLVASIVHMHEIVFDPLIFTGTIVERIFATVQIADYETRQNTLISTWIIIISMSVSFFAAISVSIGIANSVLETVFIYSCISSVINAISLIAAVIIYRTNKAYLNRAKSTISYSLSTNFQLVENFHVFRAFANCGIASAIAFLTSSVAVQLHLYYRKRDDHFSSLFGEVFNVSHSIAVPVTIALVVFSMPTMRRDFQQSMRKFFHIIPTPAIGEMNELHEATGDAYFNNLRESWNSRAPTSRETVN